MPVDPGAGERLAARVSQLVADAETDLLRLLAQALREELGDAEDYTLSQAATMRVQQLALDLRRGVRGLDAAVVAEIQAVVREAFNIGSALAVADLDDADLKPSPAPNPIVAAEALAAPAAAGAQEAIRRLPDLLTATYREALQAGAQEVLGGLVTRRAAAQHVLDRLGEHGVTGFVDKAGRRWALTSYVEMGVRTASGQAAVQGHVDTLAASGLDLVVVSDAPRECPLCRPWEGSVLSISGSVAGAIGGDERTLRSPSVTTGRPARVRIAGTLAQARAAGFQHPNCRHSVSAYLPGATSPQRPKANPAGYEAGQRQRAMERKVRQWKRRQALALDDESARRAAVKVRTWQTALREHVDANDLKRLRYREQIGTAT